MTSADGRAPATPQSLYRSLKRVVDLVFGSMLFVVTAPLMAVIGLAIRRDSPGPALFRQERVGQHGATFEMVKFRTMSADADESIHRDYYRQLVEGTAEARLNERGERVFLLDDPRVTRVGRFLRQTSLDELPNIFNVLSGEMSLVGPRPAIGYEVELYDDRARGRLVVKPGMTGLAQVSGRGQLTFQEIIDLDLAYVDRRSLLLDLRILLATPARVFQRRGV